MVAARTAALLALALVALPARAGETSASFAVGARVVRSGSVSASADAEGRLALRTGRGVSRAGVAVATESAWRSGAVPAGAAAGSAALARARPDERVVVTVLLDGQPTAMRILER